MVVTQRRSWRILTLAMVAVLTLSACGSDEEESGGDDRKVAKIGVIVPLLSGSTAIGIGIRNSVDLAIKQANDNNTVPGWRLEIAAEDDGGKPDVGARAATKLGSDSATVAVIGTYNSSVAAQTIPILDGYNIAQVSPANTSDTLTRGENFATAPARPNKNYFRTATLDSLQGGFGADYATSADVDAKTVVIVHDGKTYGKGLAESFQARFTGNGGTVLGEVRVIAEDVTDYSSDVTSIAPLNADLIFYGGEYTAGARFTTELKKQGVTAPVFGGDGIVDQTYITNAQNSANGDLGTSIGAPAEGLASATAYLAAYAAASYSESPSAYGGLAYDAANAVIGALGKVLPGKDRIDSATRAAIIDAIQATSFDGATGKVAFDQYGDTVTKLLTVYQVADNAWKPLKTGEFSG